MYIFTYMHKYIHKHMPPQTHKRTCIHLHLLKNKFIKHTHTQTHTDRHTHTPRLVLNGQELHRVKGQWLRRGGQFPLQKAFVEDEKKTNNCVSLFIVTYACIQKKNRTSHAHLSSSYHYRTTHCRQRKSWHLQLRNEHNIMR